MTAPLKGFPASTTDQWRRLALGVLRKAGRADEQTTPEQVDELLSTMSHDGVRSAPLYTPGSALPEPGLPGEFPFVRGGRAAGEAIAGWDVRQRHADPDVAVTREAVLTDLENGATSLWLVLGDAGLPIEALGDVLRPVQLDLAGLVLDAGDRAAEAAEAWFALGATGASGGLGLDPLGVRARLGAAPVTGIDQAAALALRLAAEQPGMRALTVDATVYHDAGGGDSEELGCAVATGLAYLRALTGAGFGLEAAFAQLEFRFAATADQFATIAKFRAARQVWARVAEVCGVPAAGAQRQHAVTSTAMMTARDPWSNLLRTTLAGFAAGVAGADAVTVQPFDLALGRPDQGTRRLARNTHAILLEESNVARVADPAGGSWYVEQLTASVAQAAWAWFTEIERAGGMTAALESGLIADRLAATRERRDTAIAHRRDPITGVSEFPSLDERRPRRTPAPTPPAFRPPPAHTPPAHTPPAHTPPAPTLPAFQPPPAGAPVDEGSFPEPALAGGLPHAPYAESALSGGLPQARYSEAFEKVRDLADAAATRPTVFLATLGPPAVYSARAGFAANLFAAGGIATTTAAADGFPEALDDPAQIAAAFTASGSKVACLCSSDKRYAQDAEAVAAALTAAGARRVWLAGRPGDYQGIGSYLFAGCDAVDVLHTTLRDLEVA
ncbi:MAG: methylmalonyl-CoA mutase subunit beta [Actinoplanes sp.]